MKSKQRFQIKVQKIIPKMLFRTAFLQVINIFSLNRALVNRSLNRWNKCQKCNGDGCLTFSQVVYIVQEPDWLVDLVH